MIKKTLGLFIFGSFSIGITFGYSCINDNFPSSLGGDYCYNIGDYEYNSTIKDNKFNFYNVNLDGKLFTYKTYGIIWWENDGLHLTKQNYNSSNKINGTIDGFFTCENYLPTTDVNLSDDSNCIYHAGFNDFGQYIGSQNKYFFGRNTANNYFFWRLCLYTDNYNSTFVCVEYNNYNGNNHSKFTQLGTTFLTTSTVMETAVNNPFISSGGGGSGTTVIRTGKNYYCPTYGELMKTYGMNYNTGLCYNGTMRYLNGSITTVPQQDIFTVFNNDFNNFKQRINVYNNNCIAPATQTQCENAFNGEREKYSIIANAMHNNVDDIGLWNYCNIAKQDPNISTCVANPGEIHKEKPTPEELIDYIGRIGDIGMIMTPTTGNILEDLLGEGQTRDDIATRDIFGQLDQIKDKIAGIFEKRSGVDGIIPDYILWLILVSLLLTVLLKK